MSDKNHQKRHQQTQTINRPKWKGKDWELLEKDEAEGRIFNPTKSRNLGKGRRKS